LHLKQNPFLNLSYAVEDILGNKGESYSLKNMNIRI